MSDAPNGTGNSPPAGPPAAAVEVGEKRAAKPTHDTTTRSFHPLRRLRASTGGPSGPTATQGSSRDRWPGDDSKRKDSGASYSAGLVGTLFGLPMIATILILALYLFPWPDRFFLPRGPGLALIGGCLLSLAVWLALAKAMRRFATPSNANVRDYSAIREELCALDARLALVEATGQPGQQSHAGGAEHTEARAQEGFRAEALAEAHRLREEITRELNRPGLAWISAVAYTAMWRLLHRLEETLIDLEPVETVIRGALYDEARLEGSVIANREGLLVKLRMAVLQLSPSAAIYLDRQPPASSVAPRASSDGSPQPGAGANGPNGASAMAASQPGSAAPLPTHAGSGSGASTTSATHHQTLDRSAERQARATAREVRRVINDFRDDQWNGLVLLRSHTVATLSYTALLVLGMFGLAIARGASIPMIQAAAAFFLVGATVGLFNRLYIQSQQEYDMDDHGLATVRLLLAPMLSGMAAVGGVVITMMLYATLFTSSSGGSAAGTMLSATTHTTSAHSTAAASSTPSAAPSSGGATASTSGDAPGSGSLSPAEIFDLDTHPYGLLIAAVFGLTPGLLLSGLQQQSDRYKASLKSSQATASGRP